MKLGRTETMQVRMMVRILLMRMLKIMVILMVVLLLLPLFSMMIMMRKISTIVFPTVRRFSNPLCVRCPVRCWCLSPHRQIIVFRQHQTLSPSKSQEPESTPLNLKPWPLNLQQRFHTAGSLGCMGSSKAKLVTPRQAFHVIPETAEKHLPTAALLNSKDE